MRGIQDGRVGATAKLPASFRKSLREIFVSIGFPLTIRHLSNYALGDIPAAEDGGWSLPHLKMR
jgi:hypothetical protein